MDGFQKPLRGGERKNVKIAIISSGETENGYAYAECSCGEPFIHRREKVRDAQIERHVSKKHGGRVIWR